MIYKVYTKNRIGELVRVYYEGSDFMDGQCAWSAAKYDAKRHKLEPCVEVIDERMLKYRLAKEKFDDAMRQVVNDFLLWIGFKK